MLGAETELDMLPAFGELALLLPHASIAITMFGHEVQKAWRRAPGTSIAKRAGAARVYHYCAPAAPLSSAAGAQSSPSGARELSISLGVSCGTWQECCDSGEAGWQVRHSVSGSVQR